MVSVPTRGVDAVRLLNLKTRPVDYCENFSITPDVCDVPVQTIN